MLPYNSSGIVRIEGELDVDQLVMNHGAKWTEILQQSVDWYYQLVEDVMEFDNMTAK